MSSSPDTETPAGLPARAATPLEALQAGASHIVCGRPITAANDPQAAARRVAGEMSGA